ncbi:MAG TPA: FkbM family methyltransferase [Thermoanaerobaculia bacterium]|nr:FkbM family methyltransferase [Thermoanaerobaculia bacterium]
MKTYELPNGLRIACQSWAETRFFYHEIFEEKVYLRNGITLRPGATVYDVGANIGLFTLFVLQEFPGSRVFSFEPCPTLFEIARANAALLGGAEVFNVGLSDRARRASFTFYPNSPGMSSCYADEAEEREVLRTLLENQLAQGVAGMDQVIRHADDLLAERLKTEIFEVELRPLSEVIHELGTQRIDLLKIDVQKSEADVVAGIDEADWEKIEQVVLEVHDIGGRLGEMVRLLEARGFTVDACQDELYTGSTTYNLFARRDRASLARRTAPPRPGVEERARNLRLSLRRPKSSIKGDCS